MIFLKTNEYFNEFLKTIEQIKVSGKKPRLLLHACCAPCSSAVLEKIYEVFSVTLFFYNPNITQKSEYDFRLSELERLTKEMPNLRNINILNGNYEPQRFFEISKGLEMLPEGGERCFKCYRLRLEETAKTAKSGGYDYFCTTLSISPHKNAAVLNEIGKEIAETYGVDYLFSDFKKQNGYLRSIELSKQHNLYRQSYCGCLFSKNQREHEEAIKKEFKNTN